MALRLEHFRPGLPSLPFELIAQDIHRAQMPSLEGGPCGSCWQPDLRPRPLHESLLRAHP